jgi:hypothetical protein
MKNETHLGELIRWRCERAEAEAPPAPSAAILLGLARPSRVNLMESYEAYVASLNWSKLLNLKTTPAAGLVIDEATDTMPDAALLSQG